MSVLAHAFSILLHMAVISQGCQSSSHGGGKDSEVSRQWFQNVRSVLFVSARV